MAIVWAESFDLYGTSAAALSLRGYTQNSGNLRTTGSIRTGQGCYECSNTVAGTGLTKVLDNPCDVLGIGAGINMSSNNNTLRESQGFRFGQAASVAFISVTGNVNLGLTIWQNSTALAISANNLMVLGSFYWLEAKATRNIGGVVNTGTVEVRLNDVVVLVATGVDIPLQFTRFAIGRSGTTNNGGGDARYDDLVVWDGTGTVNNDFLGDRRCFTSFASADTAFADWTPSTGVIGYQMIDEPNPVDTDYVQAALAGNVSEFQKDAIGIATNDIAAIQVIARALKSDAGISTFTLGVHSGAFVQNGPAIAPNTTATYHQQIFETNPNGVIPWTKAAVDAATVRLTRVT